MEDYYEKAKRDLAEKEQSSPGIDWRSLMWPVIGIAVIVVVVFVIVSAYAKPDEITINSFAENPERYRGQTVYIRMKQNEAVKYMMAFRDKHDQEHWQHAHVEFQFHVDGKDVRIVHFNKPFIPSFKGDHTGDIVYVFECTKGSAIAGNHIDVEAFEEANTATFKDLADG